LNWRIHNVFHVSLISKTKEDTVLGWNPAPQPVVKLTDQELWVINKFVNSRWFRGKFQLKVHWEDQGEDQDDWCDHETILREAAAWREQLAIEDLPEVDPMIQLWEEYYAMHPGAPWHDDPPHQQAAPPRTRAVRWSMQGC
jgi:hypothetical protein